MTVRAIRLILPRRSAYSMAGDSRTKWQHSIQRVGYDAFGKLETAPFWNPLCERRFLKPKNLRFFEGQMAVEDRASGTIIHYSCSAINVAPMTLRYLIRFINSD